ncbi:hypothetical protein EVA_21935, partial [gut metagenome]
GVLLSENYLNRDFSISEWMTKKRSLSHTQMSDSQL